MKRGPKDRYRFSHQGKLTWLILGAVAPSIIILMSILWFGDYSAKVQWTITLLITAFGAAFISTARDHVIHPLQTMSNLLAALREGDYSIRARGARADDALGEVLLEVNTLGETLRVQRLGAFEATALLRTIMAEIDVSVFTFDPDRRLRLVNRAGEDSARAADRQTAGAQRAIHLVWGRASMSIRMSRSVCLFPADRADGVSVAARFASVVCRTSLSC